ncbi:two-component response regulator (plasmid) [Nostoc sp. NIES-3756]|uniref:LuxR C-terminal-related transcriptional regulator n=1 Tax=Nostoc sp. NIES-3756 TaxID=1751286 RepID=UPI0007200162|nr:response regulator transcription factor [Nostoc sp. NIES-3756]BAT56766.1 two-component response regulator [Nostoc sp. NIES-3756]
MIRVLIVEDVPITRVGLKTILNRIDIEVHEADSNLGLQQVKLIRPDVVILKLDIDLITSVKQESLNTKIVVLGQQVDEGLLKLAFSCGATSYLLQDTKPDILLYAVEMSSQGQCWVDPRVSRSILDINKEEDNSLRKGKKFGESLTPTEMKVLRLMAVGFSNVKIASTLHLSPGSIRGYTNSLNLKLGSQNRVHAVFRAIYLGYIDCNSLLEDSSSEILEAV